MTKQLEIFSWSYGVPNILTTQQQHKYMVIDRVTNNNNNNSTSNNKQGDNCKATKNWYCWQHPEN